VDDESLGRIEARRCRSSAITGLSWDLEAPSGPGALRLYVDKLRASGWTTARAGDGRRARRPTSSLPVRPEVSSPARAAPERELRWRSLRVRWLAGGQEVRGRLAAVEPERLGLDTAEGRVELERAAVTKARLEAEVPWPRKV
jgi:hypothetical protein